MRNITSAYKTFLAGDVLTRAFCLAITRTDSAMFHFTAHDKDIVFGGQTYKSVAAYNTSANVADASLAVDNLEVVGILSSDSITEDDIRAGLWDFASYELFECNYADTSPTMGKRILRTGTFGDVKHGRADFTVELRGLSQALTRTVARLTARECDADLGDLQSVALQPVANRCKLRLNPPTWAATTAMTAIVSGDASLGSLVKPTAYNGFYFECTTPGTTGGTEPSWNLTLGGTTSDGSVVWKTIRAWTVQGSITGETDNRILFDTSRTEPGPAGGVAVTGITQAKPGVVTAPGNTFVNGDVVMFSGVGGMYQVNGLLSTVSNISGSTFTIQDTTNFAAYTSGGTVTPVDQSGWFDHGLLTFTSGLNAGLSMEVKAYVPGVIVLWQAMPYTVAVGDTYKMTVGCTKRFVEDCASKFSNQFNFRGFPHVPLNKIYQYGGE